MKTIPASPYPPTLRPWKFQPHAHAAREVFLGAAIPPPHDFLMLNARPDLMNHEMHPVNEPCRETSSS